MTCPLGLHADRLSGHLHMRACLDLKQDPGKQGPSLGTGTEYSARSRELRKRLSTPSSLLLLCMEVAERGLPEVETFLNKSFNFSRVDTAALTQSHV